MHPEKNEAAIQTRQTIICDNASQTTMTKQLQVCSFQTEDLKLPLCKARVLILERSPQEVLYLTFYNSYRYSYLQEVCHGCNFI